jgi:hypothetical protein
MPASQWWIIAPVGGGTSGNSHALPNGSVVVQATTQAQITAYNNSFNSGDSSGTNFTYKGKQYNAVAGPFTSQATAQNEITTGSPTLQQVGLPPDVVAAGGAANAVSATVKTIKNPIAGIADFFQRLGEASLWERVGLFIAGGVLVYIGLKASFGETAAGQAVKHGAEKAKNAGIKAATVAAL